MAGSITLKDVAAEAGVSYTTAAATFRGERWVPDATRQEVMKAAGRLGYRRHSAASILASGRYRDAGETKTIAIGWLTSLFPGLPHSPPRNMQDACAERGWIFHFENVQTPEEAVAVARRWEAIGVDGVILGRIMYPAIYECFPWERFMVVSTEVTRLVEGFDVVRPSYFAATLELQREIWRRGYRRIGVWLREHEESHPDDEARMGAALLFQRETGVALPVFTTSFTNVGDLAPMRDWLASAKPDAVVAARAMDLPVLEAAGWKTGGFAGLVVRKERESSISGLRDREEVVPELLLDLLERKMRTGERGRGRRPQEIIQRLPFLEGQTLRAVG